jgi:hypothetical protein
MDIVYRFKELRRMGICESRAKLQAATEHARSTGGYVSAAMKKLEHDLHHWKETPTRSGGLL